MNNLVKSKRIEKKLTQLQIANELNISRITVAQYESKKRFPSKEILAPYSKILGITVDDYLKWFNK